MWFTDSSYERMMVQRPTGRRESPPPKTPVPCQGCSYHSGRPCVGFCMKKLMEKQDKKKAR